MRVTKQLAERLYNTAIVPKKKHKEASIKLNDWCELMNMINVLNTVGEDQSSINGYPLDEYLIPEEMTDMMMPITLTLTGDSFGLDLMDDIYKGYNPWDAGYVTKEDAEKVLPLKKKLGEEDGKTIAVEYLPSFREMCDGSPMNNFEVGNFRCFLKPAEFKTLCASIHGNFKVTASESRFKEVSETKKYKSLTDLEGRLTPSETKCVQKAEYYVPVITDVPMLKLVYYSFDSELMMEKWFCAACDKIMEKR